MDSLLRTCEVDDCGYCFPVPTRIQRPGEPADRSPPKIRCEYLQARGKGDPERLIAKIPCKYGLKR